ncbi:PAS domain S-box-containing protein [Candidatus Electrothrix aarhusensis]|uniref:histidine kinase n=1 Tax=Candidatus Electrothrix aarhusensis TaxID=1859131 RepID=A0A444J2S9_9BACT|nr:PAS domain S-box-containing protein [Candidatus Electrothrix aarhusensis]
MQSPPFKTLYLTSLTGVILWTAVVGMSLAWNIHVERRQVTELVENEVRSHFNKDQAFRFWASSHGGVYVPVSEETPPNPHLSHILERDIITPSGKKLTLMNPAYMLHQMMKQYEKLYGVKGRITSLQPLNPDNAPDEWEKKSLRTFEQGVEEVLEYTKIKGEPYLRLMRPMIAKADCLKCHAKQGYKEGDIRGGVGISLPLASYQKASDDVVRQICSVYALLWFILLPVFFFFYKKMQSRLREKMQHEAEQQEWAGIFKHAQWGIALSKIDKVETFSLDMMNPAFAEMHGRSVEELRGTSYFDLIDTTCRNDVGEYLQMVDNKGYHVFEARHFRKEGISFPVEVNITVVRDSAGKQLSWIMNVQDISGRKEAERLIVQARDEWQRTFDAINEIIFLLDPTLRVLRANRVAEQYFDVRPGGLVGLQCFELFREASSPCEGCPAVKSIQECRSFSCQIKHQNSERSNYFLVSAAPIFDETKKMVAVVCFAKNISELKQLESKVRQAQKMEAIGTLAGGIAHDFNNILSPIMGYAELLSESLPGESVESFQAQQIYNAALRARDLVKQILSFSRQTDQALQSLEPHLIVKEALKLLRSSIPASIAIKQSIDNACGKIMADPTQIHQVVVNLCTNAYQAMMDTGGILGVTMRPFVLMAEDSVYKIGLTPGSYILIEVSDTGHGITPNLIEKIFEPYFTTKKNQGGTGLGLATVHAIVHDHKGTVSVYSEPGQGTTFRVYLPQLKEEEEQSDELFLAGVQNPSGTEHILVVDDEKAVVDITRYMLMQLGYKVTVATDSLVAWELFVQQPDAFDLVITDMAMPNMTGIELAKKILEQRPEIPVILCTGFSEMINEEKAKSLGIKAYLMKPVLKSKLAASVRQAFGEVQEQNG